MNREQLEHVLRAAAAIAQENSLVVVGSQAVLLPFPAAPAELLVSREVDLYPSLHPERADLIDGAIDKDADFVRVLLREGMILATTLDERIGQLDAAKYPVATIGSWAGRRAGEAAAAP